MVILGTAAVVGVLEIAADLGYGATTTGLEASGRDVLADRQELDRALDKSIEVCQRVIEGLKPDQELNPYLVLLPEQGNIEAHGFRSFNGNDQEARERLRYQVADVVLAQRPAKAVSAIPVPTDDQEAASDAIVLTACDCEDHYRSALVRFSRRRRGGRPRVLSIARSDRLWGETKSPACVPEPGSLRSSAEPATSLKVAMHLAALGTPPLGSERIEQSIAAGQRGQ